MGYVPYEKTCNALAGCDFECAKNIAAEAIKMGEKDPKYVFQSKDWNLGIGQSLYGVLVGDDSLPEQYLPLAHKKCTVKRVLSWAPIPVTIEGIWKQDIPMINEGLEIMAKMHHRYAKSVGGAYGGSYEDKISIFGIAFANLAIHRGLEIQIPDHKYFPKDLIYTLS